MNHAPANAPAPPPLDPGNVSPWFAKWGWLWLVGGLAALIVLWRFEPSGQAFYPRCWLYQTTGLKCPGCGSTRALHALLHGEVRTALQLNPLAVLGTVIGAWLGVRWLWGWRRGRWWPNPFAHPYGIALMAGIAVGFGITRNFAWSPW